MKATRYYTDKSVRTLEPILGRKPTGGGFTCSTCWGIQGDRPLSEYRLANNKTISEGAAPGQSLPETIRTGRDLIAGLNASIWGLIKCLLNTFLLLLRAARLSGWPTNVALRTRRPVRGLSSFSDSPVLNHPVINGGTVSFDFVVASLSDLKALGSECRADRPDARAFACYAVPVCSE